jgi:signal transduction histidine kinase
MRSLRVVTCVGLVLLLAGASLAGEKGTEEEAKAMLDRAVKTVESEGEEKAIAAFNDPEGGFRDRDLYVFCMDKDNKITAHPNAEMRGTDVSTLEDPDGKPIGKEMIAMAAKGGGSIEYRYMNPVSKKVENKISFLKKAGTQNCGVGAYK